MYTMHPPLHISWDQIGSRNGRHIEQTSTAVRAVGGREPSGEREPTSALSRPQPGQLRLKRLDLAAALAELVAERIAHERVLRLVGLELGNCAGGLVEDLALGVGVLAGEQHLELVDAVVDALATFALDLFLRADVSPRRPCRRRERT